MNLGEVVELGHHRLVCGDAFNPEHREFLLQGEKPDMLYCDPPYGIGHKTNFSTTRPGRGRITGGNPRHSRDYPHVIGDDSPFDSRGIIEAFTRCREQFWFGAEHYRESLPSGGSWIVWDKRVTDACDKAFGAHFELCWSRSQHARVIARVRWAGVLGTEIEPIRGRVHPTQKPVALAEWFLSRYSKENGIILDLFAGSGSTLLACERMNRRALVMEIDPHYCTVIEQRYHALAKQPRLLESA